MADFDVNAWVGEMTKSGALSASEAATLTGIVSKEPVAKAIGEGVLRQSDYSRRMNEVQAAQKKAEEIVKQNDAWRKEAQAKVDAATSALDNERTTRSQYEKKLKAISEEYGIEVAELKAAAKEDTTPVPAGKKAISYEEFSQTTTDSLRVQALLVNLANEHQALFGKTLDVSEIVDKSLETGKPVRAVWEEMHSVSAKKQELQDKDRTAWEERIRREEREKVLSERTLPGARTDTPQPAIVAMTAATRAASGAEHIARNNQADRQDRIRAAAQDFEARMRNAS